MEQVDSAARIQVSDSGQGIRAEFLPYVFDRFRQADASSTRVHGGLGLGLAIVRHLVELHGGSVAVRSDGEGKGTTFTVHLPIAAVDGNVAAPTESGEWPLPADMPIVRDLTALHVLVVEDEPDGRELIAAVLGECGARVTTAGSVSEALEAFDADRPDLLLSDIGLPGEDGYELIRKIRERGPENGGDIPAVALTAYASAMDKRKALRAGFQHHVSKPVEPADLTAVIAKLAERRQRAKMD